MMKFKTKDMILVSLFAALTAMGAYLKIPTQPVPFTMQIVFVMFSGLLLGGRRAFAAQAVYVSIGLLGIPVFAGGASGPGYVLSPSFGYLIGFMAAAYVIGKLAEKTVPMTFAKSLGILGIGLVFLYSAGIPYLFMILKYVMGKEISFTGALAAGFTPFILQDLIKVFVTGALAVHILPVLKKAGLSI